MGKRLFLSGALSLLVLPVVTLAVPGPSVALAATASPSPSPSQSPCLTPDQFTMNVSPSTASSGDPVTVSANYRTETCRNQPQPVRAVTLYARHPDGSQGVADNGQSDSNGNVTFVEHPTVTSSYSLTFDGQGPFSRDGYDTVTINGSPSPSPSQSPCLTPDGFSIGVSPSAAATGDPVTVSTSHMTDLCRNQPQPARTVTLYAKYPDGSQAVVDSGQSDANGSITFVEHPTVTSVYSATFDDQGPYTIDGHNTVTITRTDGSCAGAVRLNAPPQAPIHTPVAVTGTTSATGTVTILFSKRGQSAFQARRSVTPAADGTFSTSFAPDDDYRLYAATTRCDSQPLLVQATPTIAGPATVRRGATVTLTVRALPGTPVHVFFHRAFSTGYTQRRSGTASPSGAYTTTYVADADYRYYAVGGPDGRISNNGLTQAR